MLYQTLIHDCLNFCILTIGQYIVYFYAMLTKVCVHNKISAIAPMNS